MKKAIMALMLIVVLGVSLLLVWPKNIEKPSANNNVVDALDEARVEKRSVFISYLEFQQYVKGKSEVESKKNITTMIDSVRGMGFNEVIVQVRSFADAIYPSKIFPWSSVVSSVEGEAQSYDILQYFIDEAHKKDISFIAWINPYRVRTNTNVSSISEKSPAYKYINTDYLYVNNGIYFNPSKSEVTKLIVDGVLEIVSNYKVDGVLFDDYFYPNNNIDMNDYKLYLESHEYITKEQYNLNVISNMIEEVYKVCKQYNVKFGVSPDGNIDNNYNKVYADVRRWCSDDKYIDFIMPQVYYGFYNGSRPFVQTVREWEQMITNDKIDLYVALAFYKIGNEDTYAKGGKYEWIENDDIIMREIVVSRNLEKYRGFSLFRYDYIFNSSQHNAVTPREIENMKKVLK